ncbi:CDP-alcohol phosphatidyltransferase family protein [Kineococcus radiotolerans]|uniref:Cytidyltransferase-related domain n=1 Tax=Kineococcus radiotolerans (strain ATCC BAA-149 / DSM 14245 / SRS30216) TaxID=266940 RepID=A6W920_KINRD|nr:CDP-alcohol phosphatidyltransferase family protein [Kineococcus radiotolerans]ABS03309.1 cytidyltransferase-related domain [Kineococcus radiotolerans SRS30216 = ATCC BAA-149]
MPDRQPTRSPQHARGHRPADGRVGFATGAFDLFDATQLHLLEDASSRCDLLCVGVTTDELAERLHGVRPVVPFSERLLIVSELRCVDVAVAVEHTDALELWESLRFDELFVDDRAPADPATEDRLLEIGVDVTHLHTAASAGPDAAGEPDVSVRTHHQRLRTAQKPSRGVSLYSSRVNRPAGRWLAALAAALRMTPDQLTWASALVSLVGVALVALPEPSPLTGVLAAVVLAAAFALDSADGQLARLTGGGSAAGEWLDHVVDCAVKICLHSAVLVAWYRTGVPAGWLLVPLLFVLASLVLFQGGTLAAKLLEARSSTRTPATGAGRLSPVLLLPVDHGVISAAFLLWGFPRLFAPVYLALALAHVAVLLALSRHWYRQLSRDGAP